MKKIIMLIILMLIVVSGLFGQVGKTYYYKYVETVNTDTGVKSKGSSYAYSRGSSKNESDKIKKKIEKDNGVYITFTNNSCYFSDSNGMVVKDSPGGYNFFRNMVFEIYNGSRVVFSYYGERNNLYVFVAKYSRTDAYNAYYRPTTYYEDYLYFSKDYKRFNYKETEDGNDSKRIEVHEKATPPELEPEKEFEFQWFTPHYYPTFRVSSGTGNCGTCHRSRKCSGCNGRGFY